MNNLTDNMSVMQIRLIMKENGWNSSDKISNIGWGKDEKGNLKFGFSIWFERWDWHDIKCDKVCIHGHTSDLNKIDKIVYKTAKKALDSWEKFKDTIPCQLANGSLK